MINELEKLRKISNIIGYNIPISIEKDVRSYVFTPEFIEKLASYLFQINNENMILRDNQINGLMKNLNDPVTYLFNLLELGTKLENK